MRPQGLMGRIQNSRFKLDALVYALQAMATSTSCATTALSLWVPDCSLAGKTDLRTTYHILLSTPRSLRRDDYLPILLYREDVCPNHKLEYLSLYSFKDSWNYF